MRASPGEGNEAAGAGASGRVRHCRFDVRLGDFGLSVALSAPGFGRERDGGSFIARRRGRCSRHGEQLTEKVRDARLRGAGGAKQLEPLPPWDHGSDLVSRDEDAPCSEQAGPNDKPIDTFVGGEHERDEADSSVWSEHLEALAVLEPVLRTCTVCLLVGRNRMRFSSVHRRSLPIEDDGASVGLAGGSCLA